MNGASSMMNYQYAIRSTLRKDQRAQKNLFMQNKPNFPRFCAKNGYLGEKQTQSNPIQSQFKANQTQFYTIYAENKPKQTQFQTSPAQRFNKIINNQSSIINEMPPPEC